MKDIAIVGARRSTKFDAPYDDPSWEVWACSVGNWKDPIPRWDVWFELHPNDDFSLGYWEFLKQQPKVFVRGLNLPGAVEYPKAEMEAMWGPFFFVGTIAHMLALAVASEPKRIGLYGVHQSADEEYFFQRPSCQYYIQMARSRGIDIFVPEESEVLLPVETAW